ncbi:MAG: VWA domain-containing protein [Candidatus Dependentiae bacterium]|nr:VWA domain-containing protein [Candidatus Dependentiae bacterium]
MATFFQFAYQTPLVASLAFLVVIIFIRYKWYRPTLYIYPLADFLQKRGLQASSLPAKFFFWIRLASLLLMAILIGKPQFVDSKSKITVDGIDIVLVLDVSGSMNFFDDIKDRRSRLSVAKQEALNFIDKRQNDAIGLVIFGRYAIARCPLTLDKNILKEIVSDLEIGQPSRDMADGTMLSQGLVTAVRRLQTTKSKSKIIVLLTDGEPSPGDLDPKDALLVAKNIGVKVYTIGIGGDQGGLIDDPVFGVRVAGMPLNKSLLQRIAQETGGQFFEAKKPQDLKMIYDKIDKLEKKSYETELYNKYHDYFMPILWWVIILISFELFVATWVWFIV